MVWAACLLGIAGAVAFLGADGSSSHRSPFQIIGLGVTGLGTQLGPHQIAAGSGLWGRLHVSEGNGIPTLRMSGAGKARARGRQQALRQQLRGLIGNLERHAHAGATAASPGAPPHRARARLVETKRTWAGSVPSLDGAAEERAWTALARQVMTPIVSVSICLSVCLPACLSVCLSACLFANVCLSVSAHVCLSA